LAIEVIQQDGTPKMTLLNQLKAGDKIAIRVGSLIPVDCFLDSAQAAIDYSFVTGESKTVIKEKGAQLYAGGKIVQQACEATVLKTVSESELMQLWKQPAFQQQKDPLGSSITDQISRYFTPAILSFAAVVSLCWMWIDASRVGEIFTAILIVACPCALALSAPFVWGHLLRYFDRLSCYPRTTETLEKLTHIDHVVLDKTGTLTDPHTFSVSYQGTALNQTELEAIKSVCYQSNHPLSQALFRHLKTVAFNSRLNCLHHLGSGLEARINHQKIKVGSAAFVGLSQPADHPYSQVHIALDECYKGCFVMQPDYRPGLQTFLKQLQCYPLSLLSGDGQRAVEEIPKKGGVKMTLLHDQTPFQKIAYIESLQKKGHRVLMIGDGLNDAGALQQSNVGLAVHNDTHPFTPACDLIMYGQNLFHLPHFLNAIQHGVKLIHLSFILSLTYNLLGLGFASLGYLSPLVAAILMPLSSISVVLFASVSTFWLYRNLKNKLKN
jgi:Cu+-exporting ATPase